MNNEFKKVKSNGETRFVLEFSDGGSTSAGSIASVEKPLGELQRRAEPPKPRNFVAKNAKMGGAGQHKDKKKADKQGDVKHRKPFAEGDVVPLGKKHRGDLEDTRSCPKCGGDLQGGTYMGHRVKVCHPCSQVYLPPNSGIDQKGNKIGEQGVAEGSEQYDEISDKAFDEGYAGYSYRNIYPKGTREYEEYHEGWYDGRLAFEKANDYESDFYISRPEQGVAEGEKTMSRAAKGNEKYGKDGMKALAKAGREGASDEKLDKIRDKYDNYNEEAKHGLYYNVNKRKAAGTSRPASSPKAPTAQAWKDAAKTAKKESIAESEGRCMQCGMKDCKCPGTSCKCKPIAGWVPGKGFKKATDEAANAAQQAAIAIAKKKKQGVEEEWSKKYKSSINCSHPKGFSQKAHCAGKKKHNESMMTMEAVCPDCGMCQTHGNISEIKKGAKDSNGVSSCWSGYHAAGTKKGRNGGQVRNCVPNEGIAENPDWYNDEANSMSSSQLKSLYKHAMKLRQAVKRMQAQGDTLEPWQQSKVTKAADYLDAVFNAVDDEHDMGEQTELESVGIPSYGVGGYRNRGDDERHDLDDPELQRNRQEVTYYNITIDGKPINPEPIFGRSATIAWGKKHAATGVDLSNAMISPVKYTEDAYMESLQNMLERSVSQAQHNLMVGVAHNPAFAQKVKVKRAVGQEFANADQGHDISKLPIRVPKKK